MKIHIPDIDLKRNSLYNNSIAKQEEHYGKDSDENAARRDGRR